MTTPKMLVSCTQMIFPSVSSTANLAVYFQCIVVTVAVGGFLTDLPVDYVTFQDSNNASGSSLTRCRFLCILILVTVTYNNYNDIKKRFTSNHSSMLVCYKLVRNSEQLMESFLSCIYLAVTRKEGLYAPGAILFTSQTNRVHVNFKSMFSERGFILDVRSIYCSERYREFSFCFNEIEVVTIFRELLT